MTSALGHATSAKTAGQDGHAELATSAGLVAALDDHAT